MNSSDWAKEEFEGITLGDKRLSDRLITITNQFISSTESPINKACGNWSGTKAAYRFFQNDNVDYNDIINHHSRATMTRAKNEDIVLAIQDTSYFNYSHHPKTQGLGILSRFTGKYKKEILTKGLYMHSTLAINTSGMPLGLINQKITAREVLSDEKMAVKKRSHNIALPIEEKESIRWLNSIRETASKFKQENKKIVTIADREADIYDLYLLAQELDTHYLIRASHNRKINKSAIHSKISGEMLWDHLGKQQVKGEVQVNVPKTETFVKRVAKCVVKFGKIKALPPRSFKGNKTQNLSLTMFTIQVVEETPPKGAKKIEWVLITNIPILNYENAIEKIKWYCLRWRIEVYFKVIKSGFNVENCRLLTAERLIRYLAVISVVAWRVFWLTMISRTSSFVAVSNLMAEDEWKILFIQFNPGIKIPKKPPKLEQIIIWIAQLGGFLARKGDGRPGITHIWRGLQKFFDIIKGA